MNETPVVDVARDQPWPRDNRSRQVAAAILRHAIQGFHHAHALAKRIKQTKRDGRVNDENESVKMPTLSVLPVN